MGQRKLFRQFRRPRVASVPFGPWKQGVNEKKEPHLLEFSELSDARNIIVDDAEGRTPKRPGTIFRTDIPVLLNAPKRAYVFIKDDGTEILLVTDNRKLATTQDLENWDDITPEYFLSGGEFAGSNFFLDFATGQSRVWITNGADPVFSWDGIVDGGDSVLSLVAHDKETPQLELGVNATLVNPTTIDSAEFNRGGAGSTHGWVGQEVVCEESTNTENIGITRIVDSFDDTSDRIVLNSGFPTPLINGDKLKVGVLIPKGRHVKYHHDTLFIAATPENASEVRFSEDVDPDEPLILMTAMNPRAWPPLNQFVVGGGGDRIWGFSNPVYRNRIAVFKAQGIYRIEPSTEFIFQPITITEQIGSRYPKSWQQHGDLLMFLGQDSDGLPDVYQTDFVSVKSFNRKHHVTLDNLRQARSISKNAVISSQAEWDAGNKSDYFETDESALVVRKRDTATLTAEVLESAVGIDISTDGKVSILGYPEWDGAYTGTGDVLPQNSTPPWVFFDGTVVSSYMSSDQLVSVYTGGSGTIDSWKLNNIISDETKDILIHFRASVPRYAELRISLSGAYHQLVMDGSLLFNGTNAGSVPGGFNDYHILLKANGVGDTLWINHVLVVQNVVPTSPYIPNNGLEWLAAGCTLDDIAWHLNWLGGQQGTFGGKITNNYPAQLYTQGTIVTKSDYIKDLNANPGLHSFGKYHFDELSPAGSTLTYQTESSDDDISYDAPVALTNGNIPSSTVRRFLKMTASLNKASAVESYAPVIREFVGGALYLSPVITIPATISAWDLFLFDISNLPSNLTLKARVGYGPASPSPVGETGWNIDTGGVGGSITDAEGFITITDRDDIGAILGGDENTPNPPFPNTRFFQFKVEASLDSIIETNGIESSVINWIEGEPELLPTEAIIWKKKWLLITAERTSVVNNLMVTVDSNSAFINWDGITTNFFIWFNGALYVGSSARKELLEINENFLVDDDGPDVIGRKTKAINAYIVTKQEHGGAIFSRKKMSRIECLGSQNTTTIDFFHKRDEATAFTLLGQVTFAEAQTHKRLNVPIGQQFKRITLKAQNNVKDENLDLEGIVMTFEQVPSRSGI